MNEHSAFIYSLILNLFSFIFMYFAAFIFFMIVFYDVKHHVVCNNCVLCQCESL